MISVKQFVVLFFGIYLSLAAAQTTSAQTTSAQTPKCHRLSDAEWLLGNWQSETEGQIITEHWRAIDEQNFVGTGTTVKTNQQKPPFVESLRLVEMSGGVFFIAKTPQNKFPVAFELVGCSDDRLKFENTTHDFPNVIEYVKESSQAMVAKVSGKQGGGFSIRFNKQADKNHREIIRRYVVAYNQKDLDGMLNLTSDKIAWMSVNDSIVTVETADKKALAKAMGEYFASGGQTQSQLLNLSENGSFVSGIEKASWQRDGQQYAQCSPVVYQLENQLIRNVWYFAAESCE